MPRILYKYLGITGGIMMLGNCDLQFTNASQLNDPFDCHPKLIDFSNVPDDVRRGVPKEWWQEKEENDALNLRNDTWLTSFSKVNDSILMWAHYANSHTGICVGLDLEKIMANIPPLFGTITFEPEEFEVQYTDIIQRPSRMNSHWYYQLQTKAKDWAYEQEVRWAIRNPNPAYAAFTPEQAKEAKRNKQKVWDWKEIHHYLPLSGECFESVYFGIRTSKENIERISKHIRKLNPNVELYQMKVDPESFRLKAEEIK